MNYGKFQFSKKLLAHPNIQYSLLSITCDLISSEFHLFLKRVKYPRKAFTWWLIHKYFTLHFGDSSRNLLATCPNCFFLLFYWLAYQLQLDEGQRLRYFDTQLGFGWGYTLFLNEFAESVNWCGNLVQELTLTLTLMLTRSVSWPSHVNTLALRATKKTQQGFSLGNKKDVRRRWRLWAISIKKKLENPNELSLLWDKNMRSRNLRHSANVHPCGLHNNIVLLFAFDGLL